MLQEIFDSHAAIYRILAIPSEKLLYNTKTTVQYENYCTIRKAVQSPVLKSLVFLILVIVFVTISNIPISISWQLDGEIH